MKRYSLRLALAIIVMAVSLAVIISSHAAIYPVQSGTIKTLNWSPPATGPVDGYEYYFLRMDSGRIFGRGEITAPTTTVRFVTQGTYALWVRSYKLVDGVKQWGPWAQSTDPAFGWVNGSPAPWLIKVNR
jgi:hypothetical protein